MEHANLLWLIGEHSNTSESGPVELRCTACHAVSTEAQPPVPGAKHDPCPGPGVWGVPPFAEEAEASAPSVLELLELLKADLRHVQSRAELTCSTAEADAFLKITELPEVLQELKLTVEEWQIELGAQIDGIRASEDAEEPSTVPLLTGSGEPPQHDDADAPPDTEGVPS